MTATDQPRTLPPRRDLTDGVVLLRAPNAADIEAIIRGAGAADVAHYTRVPVPYTAQHAEAFLVASGQGWVDSTDAVYAVCDAEVPGVLLGMLGLHGIDLSGVPGGIAEVGYWMSPEGRGRGLMTRAVRLACTWAIDELGLTRVSWYAMVGNEPSRRVAEAVGVRVEGLLRRGESRRGERLDHWVGGLLAEDLVR